VNETEQETGKQAAGAAQGNDNTGNETREIRCDLCGNEALSVHRVALDGDYDRLRKPHQVLYACPPCSEKKERQRLGLTRNSGRS
jgi:DNA-directed RNA polymerase subunit RPC12/RpoP